MWVQNSLTQFFTLNTWSDVLRILKLPVFLSLEAGKYALMIFCGCQVNELNNWMSQAIRTPYYWRIPTPPFPQYVAGPYSPIWYLVNQPAQFGYFVWMHYLFVFDLFFTAFNFRSHGWPFLMFYSANSIYFYDTNPIDFFLFNLMMLGIYNWKFSAFAVVFKIPWITLPFSTPRWFPFPPSYVWPFILNDPYAYHESPLRYAQLGTVFVTGIAIYLWKRHKAGRIALNSKEV
jgi:hypothetical protein